MMLTLTENQSRAEIGTTMDLPMLFGEGRWKVWELWVRKAIECSELKNIMDTCEIILREMWMTEAHKWSFRGN